METLVAYVPVLHEGYRRFFQKHQGAHLLIIGDEFVEEIPEYRKDIRRLPAVEAKRLIEALNIFTTVDILTKTGAAGLASSPLVLANEEPLRNIAETYFPTAACSFESVFLMWDKHNALAERPDVTDESITSDELHRRMLTHAETESQKSSDIWRHVGAVLARDGEVLLAAHNQHLPNDHTPYENGDPRNAFHKGEYIELSSAIHAEAGIIAEAARRGVSIEGSDMYVTVFPCPPCAKLIAQSGIKHLYCGGGYGVLDGQEVLENAGVTIQFVS